MRINLFRTEVLKASTDHLQGSILLAQPFSSWIFTAASLCITLSVFSYVFWGSYTKRATTTGLLLPGAGVIKIQSPASGTVVKQLVQEGQTVTQGEILFVLADERHSGNPQQDFPLSEMRNVSLAQRRTGLVKSIESTQRLQRQTQQGLQVRLSNFQEEQLRNQQEIALAQRRIAAAEAMLERHRILLNSHFISEMTLREKEDQVDALRAQGLALERQKSELRRNIAATQDELHQSPLRTQSQLAELERTLAALTQETTEIQGRDRFAITAPMAGTITAINAQLGQPVNNQTIATLLPQGSTLVAQLYAPSRTIGFVEKEQKVNLRYQAYPYQKFGQYRGHIIEVSGNPIQPGELPSALPSSIPTQEGYYRITVKLDSQYIDVNGKRIVLLPGMLLEADIEQEKRRLLEWILEPVFSLKKYL